MDSQDIVEQEVAGNGLLLAETEAVPRVTLEWSDREGNWHSEGVETPLASAREKVDLVGNVAAYATLGGARLTKGAGHPAGLIIRAGLTKQDPTAAWLQDLGPGSRLRVRIEGVRLNQPCRARVESVVQHMSYTRESLESCAIPLSRGEQYNMYSESDDLNARVTFGDDARPGVLDASAPGDGSARVWNDGPGSIGFEVEIPYALLRHPLDPWASVTPGTFVEPAHFHVEVEVLPEEILARIESGEDRWPPPSRELDESDDQRPMDGP